MENLLDTLKIMLGIDLNDPSQDERLSQLIIRAQMIIVTRTNTPVDDFDSRHNALTINMCIEMYNKLGNEGKVSESISPLSTTYMTDFSNDILDSLRTLKRMKVIK